MKKYFCFLFVFTSMLAGGSVFAQNGISQEEIIGKWKLIKGSGKDFDAGTIGSTFEFQKSGDMVIDLAPTDAPRNSDNHGFGTWTYSKDQITMNLLGEEKEIVDSIVMLVTHFDGKLLSVTMKRDGFKVVYEKLN